MITNSTPLIYLAKIGKLMLLKELFSKIHIPEAVKKEVVDQGKAMNAPDSSLVEEAIAQGWIIIKKADILNVLIKTGIDQGEMEAISLAVNMNKKEILLDQTHARVAAELVGLQPRGTLFVLLLALRKKKITYNEYVSLLEELLSAGFRMSQELYLKALQLGKEIIK